MTLSANCFSSVDVNKLKIKYKIVRRHVVENWKSLSRRNIRLQSTWHEQSETPRTRKEWEGNLNLRVISWVRFFRVALNMSKRFTKVDYRWTCSKIRSFLFQKTNVGLLNYASLCHAAVTANIVYRFVLWHFQNERTCPHCSVVYHLIFTLAGWHEAWNFLPCHFQEIAFELQ